MPLAHDDLLARLDAFSFDEPGTSFTFAQRLAKENGWTVPFTRRVIEEYKRFAYIAATAGHPVSPSDPVDQAWHLHLTYTESYWNRFCPQVLRQTLHHSPTRGGSSERKKFDQWYAQTLATYELAFGKTPPADIWPPLKKTKSSLLSFAAARELLIGCVAAGTGFGVLASFSIFDWRGPEFLRLYAVLAPIGIGAALLLRRQLRAPLGHPEPDDIPSDPYVIAALAGGPVQVVNAAIISLVEQGAVAVGNGNGWVTPAGPVPSSAHPVEKEIHRNLSPDGDAMTVVRERGATLLGQIYGVLIERGLVLTDDATRTARMLPFIAAMVVPVIGLIKIVTGVSRGKPVGYLVLMVLLSVIVGGILTLLRPRRTVFGDHVLEAVRNKHREYRPYEQNAGYQAGDVVIPTVAMAVAVYGLSQLQGTPYDDLQKKLTPPSETTGLTGCGSSCGGDAGSGGGGGDGGGGCGGGCGGCGGGGD